MCVCVCVCVCVYSSITHTFVAHGAASRLVEMSTAEYLAAHAGMVAAGKWQHGRLGSTGGGQVATGAAHCRFNLH